ncbi:MAG: glycoside hydrolase family 5 protein [Oscillospiraceae bacterium]|nr:glycoside hydrolase family 5 protein [Oscillospiraceae bacterium]
MSLLLSGCGGDTSSVSDAGTSAPVSTTEPADSTPEASEPEGNSMTALEVSRLMGNGINLGNTLEAYNHQGYLNGYDPAFMETGWGQPTTTPEMIKGMKDAGFDTIRIPIAWTNGMNFESGDYTIDSRLMNRVQEVVDYAMDADMYVIINDHWDGGWWGMFGSEDMEVREKAMEMYKSMWTQISEHFRDYSYKLIFEAANEELGDRLNDKEITGSKGILTQDECYEKAYEINSEFVKVVRSTGGNNTDRFLLIAGYNTDITMTCDDRFKMPEDTAEDKLLLSVHYYTPWDYCGTDGVNQWGSPDDFEEQNGLFERMSKFTKDGYGIVIGEYAVMMSNGGIKPDTDKFYRNLLDNCDLYNFVPVLWDCSNFFKRRTLTTSDEAVAELFASRDYEAEKSLTEEQVKENAKESLEAALEEANEKIMEDVSLPATDDTAVAWIMFQSADYSVAYSVGDKYDPTNMTMGVKAENALITGEGTYTISLDLSEVGPAKGIAFSALGIYNGETMFPGYTVTIDKVLINNAPYELQGKEYTASDDGKCTRVNLYNGWVPKAPDDARTPDGDTTDCSAQIIQLGNKDKISTISITFPYEAP